jgi:hypothetical protein
MNVNKDFHKYYNGEPPGQKTNAIRWLQKKIIAMAKEMPWSFQTIGEWEAFKKRIRETLPQTIGIPKFPEMKQSTVRARIMVDTGVICERVDVYVDEDYSIPSFVFYSNDTSPSKKPGLVWSPGWPQDKWHPSYQSFAVRMAKKGFVVLVLDHAPFGETTPADDNKQSINMTLIMSMGHLLGISQLALRAAENIRAGEYLRSRDDVDASRVALGGLCQGGMDTWLTAALDDSFCAVAPICAASTFSLHMSEMASYFYNSDSSPFPFGIMKICDVEHLHGCIAPRPLLVRVNLPDQWWPISGMDSIEGFTRKIYRLYGAEENLDIKAEVHEHDLTGPFADALENFLVKYLICN